MRNETKAKEHMVTRMCAQACLYQVDTPYNPMSIGGGGGTTHNKVDIWDGEIFIFFIF